MAQTAIRFLSMAAFLVASTVFVPGPPVHAQDADLTVARRAIAATQATASFDTIIIDAAENLKNQLTSTNPNLADDIATIVDEEAITLVSRRGALEQEAAKLFSNTFDAAELETVATFFESEAGKKYLRETPILARELSKAARVWANGINRDLNEAVQKRMAAADEAAGTRNDDAQVPPTPPAPAN